MLKFLLYTTLFTVGGYALVTRLPDSYKERMLAAIGLGEIKNKTFTVFNPAAKREELLTKLEENLVKVEEFNKANNSTSDGSSTQVKSPKDSNKGILIEGAPLPPGQLAPIIEEQKNIIEQLKDLNPKTGLVPKVMEKILGVGNPPITANQITPELKAEICK